MTKKLYDFDSHQTTFSAKVLACTPAGKKFRVLLDQTAFFPEGGGQAPDSGVLGGLTVRDVQETEEGILHTVDAPLEPGAVVTGEIDWTVRFGRMQNHSGEHIVSGLVHGKYGYNNVGFHMGEDGMLLDFDGELNREQLEEIEVLANEAVWKNLPITAAYPAQEVLETLAYRSKLDLTENVRIVTIPGVDVCACCAPHVDRTGEIGLIKILDFMRHRGGVRVRVLCGRAALEDARSKYENVAAISALLSAKQEKTAQAVERVNQDLQETKKYLGEVQRELIAVKTAAVVPVPGNLVLFEPVLDGNGLRDLVDGAMEKTGGICAGFSGSEKAGFRYVIGSRHVNLREKAKEINVALHGKGGGAPEMIQGSAQCTRREIRAFFGVE